MNRFTASDIEKYWKGDLSADQMHAIEKAALEDPFLAEAIEGYQHLSEIPASSVERDMADLDNRLRQRTKPADVTVIAGFNWWKPAIAALIVLTAGSLGYYFWNQHSSEDVAVLKPVEVPPVLAPATTELKTQQIDSSHSEPADVAVLDKPRAKKSSAIQPETEAENKIATRKVPLENDDLALPDKAESAASAIQQPAVAAAAIKEKPLFEYKGIVLNEEKKPVPGAIINLKGKVAGVSVVTDTFGTFRVPVADSTIQLTVSSVGYQSDKYQLSVMDSTNDISINLKPSNSALNEVVVTGYSSKKKSADNANSELTKDLTVKVQEAVPVPGWNEYNLYLLQKQVVPDSLKNIKGNVVLSFIVSANGKLSSFIVEQSQHPELDREAIRLVRSGPAWKILQGRRARVIVIVPF